MAEIILNLSGKQGLSNLHAGDTDQVTPSPNLRQALIEGQMVAGVFNPHLRDGYLAPSTATSVEVTTSEASDTEFRSVEYDFLNSKTYFATGTNQIFVLDNLSDTTAQIFDDIPGWENIYDLQMYYKNGEPHLFIVGQGIIGSDRENIQLASSTTGDYVTASLSILPEVDSIPVELKEDAYAGAASETAPVAMNITAGTNQCLYVIILVPDSGGRPSSVFWNTTEEMTLIDSYTSGIEPGAFIFELVNPTPANSSITYTYPFEGVTAFAVLVEHANQSPGSLSWRFTRRTGSEPIQADVASVSKNQLSLIAYKTNDATTAGQTSSGLTYIDTVLSSGTGEWDLFASGRRGFVIADIQHFGVQISATPDDAVAVLNRDWFSLDVGEAFSEQVVGDFVFMRESDNGFAYIFNGNKVHKVDGGTTGGQDGLIAKNVLLFPEGFRAVDALDYRSRLFIALHQYQITTQSTSLSNYRGRCGVFIWDRLSTVFGQSDYIELPGVREIKKIYASPDGVVKLITIGSHGLTELRAFGYNDSGGVVFPVFNTLGIGGYPQYPDGLTIAGDKAVWLSNNGALYCEKDQSVTKLYEAKTPGVTSTALAENIASGVVFYGSENETANSGFRSNKQGFVLSYNDGSVVAEKIYPFDLTTGANGAQTPNAGNVYTGVTYIPVHSRVKSLRIYNAPVSGSGTEVIATVKLYFNQSTDPTMPNGMTKSITKDEAKRGYVDFKIEKSYVHAVQIEIEWSATEPIGGDIYLPSAAVISTDETGVRSPDND